MNDVSDTQLNRKFVERWAWLPGFIKHKFTPTSVVSILIAAFSCGSMAATYRAKFHEAEKSRIADHGLLSEQTKAVQGIAVQLAHLDGTLQDLDKRLSNLEEWRNGIKEDVQNANQVKVPKLSGSRHGKHP